MEFARVRAIYRDEKSRVWLVRITLAALAAGVAILLAFAPKPWTFTFSDGSRVRVEDYAAVGLWWAGALNIGALLALALLASWWMMPLAKSRNQSSGMAGSKWFWPIVGGAMLATAAVNAPRLTHSLWDDEEYSLRRILLGSYRANAKGELKLKEVPWSHTFWYYGKPNNHFLNSITGRLSNTVWRSLARPTGLQFSEVALRLPAYLAGILSIAIWAMLLRALGFPVAGAIASWLIMLHPWHMRFVPELRGYSFVFLFLPLACLLALYAVRKGTWKGWAAYGAAQFGLFYSWPGTTVALAILNIGVLCMIVLSAPENRLTLLARWLVATAVAGMAALQLYLPCVAQLLGHLDDWDAQGLGWPWVQNVFSRLLTGMPWSMPGGTFPQLSEITAQNPALIWAFVATLVGGIAIGAWRCARSGVGGLTMMLVFLLPGPATYLFARIKDTYLFEWYVVFMVPGLMALAAIGCEFLFSTLPGQRRILALAGAAVLLIFFAFVTHPARRHLMAGPIQLMRESVLLTRPSLDPHDPRNREILTVATLATPEVYDPNIRRIKTKAELTALLREADASGRPLFVNQGYPHMLASEAPELASLISRSDLFETFATLPGMEPMFDREILRYRPGSLATPP
jgi:hypothetical protein